MNLFTRVFKEPLFPKSSLLGLRTFAFVMTFTFGSLLSAAPIPFSGKVSLNGSNFDGAAQFTFALRDARGGATNEWHKQNTLLTGPNATYGMFLCNGKFDFWLNSSSENNSNNKTRLSSASAINTGSWVHVALSREAGAGNSGSYRTYINGSKDSGPFSKGVKFNTGAQLYFGKAITSAENYLDGSLDDLRIYDRTLSDAEVKALYDLGQ